MQHLLWLLAISIVIFLVILALGTIGYHHIFGHDMYHSFYLCLCSASNLGLQVEVKTTKQKMFVALLGILTTCSYLIIIGVLTALIIVYAEIYKGEEVKIETV